MKRRDEAHDPAASEMPSHDETTTEPEGNDLVRRLEANLARIYQARGINPLTPTELARAMGRGKSQVSNLRKGTGGTKYSTLQNLAKSLGVDVSDLLAPIESEPKKDYTERTNTVQDDSTSGRMGPHDTAVSSGPSLSHHVPERRAVHTASPEAVNRFAHRILDIGTALVTAAAELISDVEGGNRSHPGARRRRSDRSRDSA